MDEFMEFMQQFYETTGVDLRMYKRVQMERRLTSLRDKRGFATFSAYFTSLIKNMDMMHELLDKMTINVSEFFRNPERWQALETHLRPRLKKSETLKAWSAACSTGEEPYTLAILCEEVLQQPYDILATDIDDHVLQSARLGVYRQHQVQAMPTSYQEKYLHGTEQTWSINPSLSNHIHFAKHNLLADSYPNDLDLIICRNVLIYFTEEAKSHVMRGFSSALREKGLLFVGSTEQFLHADECGFYAIAPFLYEKRRNS